MTPLTVAGLETALRACGVVACSATLLPSMVAVSVRVRDRLGEYVTITGESSTLEAAFLDALRKAGAR